jgi:hypothetical protein
MSCDTFIQIHSKRKLFLLVLAPSILSDLTLQMTSLTVAQLRGSHEVSHDDHYHHNKFS